MYDTYITIVLLIKLFPGASEVGSSQRHPGAFRPGWQRGHLRRLAGNAVEQRVKSRKMMETYGNTGMFVWFWVTCLKKSGLNRRKAEKMCDLFQVTEELRKKNLQIGGYPVDHSSQFISELQTATRKINRKIGRNLEIPKYHLPSWSWKH